MSDSDFSGPVAGARDRAAAAAVVEQRVDGLLQHALLVVDDDLGRAEVEQPLEAVVAVDDPAVQVVEVGRGEPAAVELDHRAQVRRDDRDGVEDHPLGTVLGRLERRDDLQPLDGLLALLALAVSVIVLAAPRRGPRDRRCSSRSLIGLGAHAAAEVVAVAGLHLAVERLVVDELLEA